MKMLKTILKNLATRKATRLYPKQKREPFANVRGELVNDIDRCIFCSACALKCPAKCIKVDREKRAWENDPSICIYCGICSAVCPTKCLYHKPEYRAPSAAKEYIKLKGAPKKS